MTFRESGGLKVFESRSAFDISLTIEMVMDEGMNRGEPLQISHLSGSGHGTFSPSKWRVGVFWPILQVETDLLVVQYPKKVAL